MPVRIVMFTPFVDSAGGFLLAREVEEHEQPPDELSAKQRSSRAKVEWVQEIAREQVVVRSWTSTSPGLANSAFE